MVEEFDEKKWKETLREAHEYALKEKDRIKSEIEIIIDKVDPVELLSYVSLLSQYIPEGRPDSNQKLRDRPTLHFLSGLCLKNILSDKRSPENHEVGQIIDLLDNYFIFFGQDLVFQSAKKENVPESDFVILSARLQKITSQINPGIYDFQLDDLLNKYFGKFNDYFLQQLGFTVSDALNFGKLIRDRYVRLINKRFDKVTEAQNNAIKDLEDPIKGTRIKEIIKERKSSEEEFLEDLDIGFTFMSQYGRKGLRERLAGYSNMKKYQLKTKRWIGIGRDVLDKDWFVNEFVYLDFLWEVDSNMEKLVSKFLSNQKK